MFKLNTLSRQIGFGYALVLLIFVISLLATLIQLNTITASSEKIKDLRNPTARASLMLLNGVNHSLAALRGWMLIGYEEGGEKFRLERKSAWQEISYSIDEMNALSSLWTNPENVERLRAIKYSLKEFEIYQNQIEQIANTELNQKASSILLNEAAPKATLLMSEVTKMIDIEKKRSSSVVRKNIFGILADIRGSFSVCIASIRAFVLSGDSKYKLEFDNQWQINNAKYSELSLNKNNLNQNQLLAFEKFSVIRAEFAYLPEKIFTARAAKDWDQAKYLLKNKAAPLAFEIKTTLSKMVENQAALQNQEYIKTHNPLPLNFEKRAL